MTQIEIGVKALILDNGKLLMVRRSSDDRHQAIANTWDIPGGRLAFGEDPLEGLKREVREETGLQLTRIDRPLDVQTVFKNQDRHIVRITFVCEASGELRLSDEHTEGEWMSLHDEIAVKDNALRATIDRLRKQVIG